MTSKFKSYINSNSYLMGSISSEYSIQLISSNFIIENSTTIYNQDYFIDGFESQLQINNTVLRDCISYSFIVTLSYSTFVSDSLTILNIFSNKFGCSMLSVLFGSVVEISNLKETGLSFSGKPLTVLSPQVSGSTPSIYSWAKVGGECVDAKINCISSHLLFLDRVGPRRLP